MPRGPIDRREILMTPGAVLAEAIAWGRDLDTGEVEEVIDSSLADPDDFVQVRGADDGSGIPARWWYVGEGERWQVRYRGGRPELAEAGTLPRGHLPLAERRFGLLVRTLESISACRLADGEVALLRADPGNAAEIERAAEADRRLAEFRRSGGPRAEVARERLRWVGQLVARFGLVPRGDLGEYLAADDESRLGRYLIVFARGVALVSTAATPAPAMTWRPSPSGRRA